LTRRLDASLRFDLVALTVSGALVVVALRGGMPGDRVNPGAPGTAVTDLIGVPIAVLLALAGGLLVLRQVRRIPPFAWIALVPMLAILSLARSHYLWASLVCLMILAGAVATGAGVAACSRSPRTLVFVVLAMTVAAGLVAALGVREYAGEVSLHNPTWRVFSTFATPNFFAGYLCMTVPLTAAVFLAIEDRVLVLLAGFALVLQSAALLLTGSRFGLVCLVAGLAVFALLAIKAGALRGSARPRALALIAVTVLAFAAGIRPVLHRLGNASVESYSAQFREYTWRGALRMALANPILGTGIGTFDTAYPRYALVSYTEHAHDSYLQLADEIGIPGALLFVGWIAYLVVRAMRTNWKLPEATPVLPLSKGRAQKSSATRSGLNRPSTAVGSATRLHVGILKAGVLGGIVGALLRNTFDSDLYVPANAFTFAALCGILAGFASTDYGTIADRAERWARILRWAGTAGCAAIAIICIMLGTGRLEAYRGTQLLRAGDMGAALQQWKAATTWDPLNPDYRLSLAQTLEMAGDTQAAGRQYQAAVRWADIGKCHYRYARFLERGHDLAGAIREFEHARTLEPLNLQNLLALAETCEAAGRAREAQQVYAQLADLYRQPVGRVRALPELVNWEFGAAYAALARQAAAAGELAEAETDYRQAVQIFKEFWDRRELQIVQVEVRPEVLRSVAARYRAALDGWERTLRALGRMGEAASVAAIRAKLERDLTSSG